MNYIKIQTDLIKSLDKGKDRIVFQEKEENVLLSIDGHRIFVIPTDKFYIDLKKSGREPAQIDKMMNYNDADDGFFRGYMKRQKNGNTLLKIENDKTYAWVDEKLLKEFGEINEYKITGPKQSVYLFNYEELLGCVLPVYVREGE